MASAGLYASLHLIPDNHANIPPVPAIWKMKRDRSSEKLWKTDSDNANVTCWVRLFRVHVSATENAQSLSHVNNWMQTFSRCDKFLKTRQVFVLQLLICSFPLLIISTHTNREPLTLLVGWQEGHLARKTEWWGTGMVICLGQDANDLHMIHLMPLPSHHFLPH